MNRTLSTALSIIALAGTISANASPRKRHHSSAAAPKSVPVKAVLVPKPAAAPKEQAPIAVIGEIKNAGAFKFETGLTVKRAIELAGGFNDRGDAEHMTLRRAADGRVGSLDGSKAMNDDAVQNVVLAPGDSIYVPAKPEPKPVEVKPATEPEPKPAAVPVKAEEAKEDKSASEDKYAIMGAVATPGAMPYKKMMLQDAIREAGGLTKDADACKTLVIRGAFKDAATAETIKYDYNQVVKGKKPDLELQPGDVIQIPPRGAKKGFFDQVGKFVGRVVTTKNIATVATGIVNPIGLAAGLFAGHKSSSEVMTEQITRGAPQQGTTALEAALAQAIAAEPADIQQRIIQRAKDLLATQK